MTGKPNQAERQGRLAGKQDVTNNLANQKLWKKSWKRKHKYT